MEIRWNEGAIAQEADFIHQGPLLNWGANMSGGVENFRKKRLRML